MSRIAFVTGATGAVGPALVSRLVNDGWAVRALVRGDVAPDVLPPGVALVRGDLDDLRALDDGMRGASVVFHFAALLHVMHPRPDLDAEFVRVNVDGTRHVVAAAMSNGVARVVAASTIAVYGTSPHIVSEATPPAPDTIYGRTKLDAERIVLDATTAAGTPFGVVLRLSAVYGAGLKGNYLRLVRAIAKGRFVSLGDGSNHRAVVFDEDVARVAAAAAVVPGAAGLALNVTDGEFHTMREIVTAIRAATGRRGAGPAIPIGPIRAGIVVADRVGALLRLRLPVSLATLDKYVEDVRIDARRLQEVVGPLAMTPLDRGWQATVDGLRSRGLL